MMNIQILLTFILLLLNITVQAQGFPISENKEVKLVYGDSIVIAEVRRQVVKELKLEPFKRYYWYTKGMIKSNAGDYHGSLLHGKYEVLLENRLIVNGAFKNGLRNGVWKYWNAEGNYEAITTWEEGIQIGEEKIYYPNGKLEAIYEYTDGIRTGKYSLYTPSGKIKEEGKLVVAKRHGKITFYENGQKRIEKYNDGELVLPKVKKEKEKNGKGWKLNDLLKKKESKKEQQPSKKEKKKFSLKNIFKKQSEKSD